MLSKLQYISQGKSVDEQLQNISSALEAGCDWVQLRFKDATEEEWFELANKTKELCAKFSAVFIVNDHVERARMIDADGVHVGLNDMKVREVRKLIGANKIVGGTANTFEDVLQRIEEKCDYIGLGPLYKTQTKKKLSPILGFDGYAAILNKCDGNKVPIVAIGSVTEEDVPRLMEIGLDGVAVSGQITFSQNKKELVKRFKSLLNG